MPGEEMQTYGGAKDRDRKILRAWIRPGGLWFIALLGFAAVSSADGRPTSFWTAAGARANGLDLNDNFVVGERGTDDTLCDARGGSDSSAGYLEDFDRDGVVEQQWFVVGNNPPNGWTRGQDSPTCGSLGSPCATLSRAWSNASADGGASNGEDVICVAGRLDSQGVRTPISGASGKKTKRPAGGTNEQWDFDYPRNPAMVVGVDSDDDGIYPPVDSDDLAVFNATASGESGFGFVTTGGVANIEVAHITLSGWGSFTKEGGGVLRQNGGTGLVDGLYFHDFRAENINRDQCHGSNTIMFSNFGSRMRNLAVEYADLIDVNGYISRGGHTEQFTRFRGLNVDMIGLGGSGNSNVAGQQCSNSNGTLAVIMRVWGLSAPDNFVEWIDNDLEFVRWQKGQPATSAAGVLLCGLRKFHYIGNRVVNFAGGLPILNSKDNICADHSPHFTGDLAFSRNTVTVTKPSLLNSGRFVNGGGWLGTATGRDKRLNGARGYYRVEDNEVDFSRLGSDNDRLSAFLVFENATDADYRDLDVLVANNDIVGRFRRNVGGLIWAPDSGSVGTVDDLVIEGNTVHDPFGGSVLEDVDLRGARHIARISGSGNSFAHCRWFLDGTRFDTPASFDAASGLRGSNCSNARPTLGNFTGGGGGGGGGSGSTRLVFTSDTYRESEGVSMAQISVERRGPLSAESRVTVTASPGTASAADFVVTSEELIFAAGESSRLFAVEILDDLESEADETVQLELSQPQGATLGARDTAVLTLEDDDFASLLDFSMSTQIVAEGSGVATVSVRRSGGLGRPVSVGVRVSGLSASRGTDYTFSEQVLSWGPGDGGAKLVEVLLIDDQLQETSELIRLELTDPTGGALLGDQAVTALILNDDDGPPSCVPSIQTLCLDGGRFSVESEWRDPRSGDSGRGMADPDSEQSGLFWFFDEDNIELIVKVLDGRALTGSHWLFYGALSDVEYYVVAQDHQTGSVRAYRNEPGSLSGVGDVNAFPEDGEGEGEGEGGGEGEGEGEGGGEGGGGEGGGGKGNGAQGSPWSIASSVACSPGAEVLCLQSGRFQVEVSWTTGVGEMAQAGAGVAVPRTDASGLFWFFDSANLELVVKVLDGRPINGKFWIFWGALSDVEYRLRVTDTVTGTVRDYVNPRGSIEGGADLETFTGAN